MKVIKDSAIYLAGELLNKALPFLLMPYLTRKLGPAGYGELSYYMTFVALLGIFIALSHNGSVTRYYYFYGKRSLPLIVSSGYVLSCLIAMVFLVFAWMISSEIIAIVTIIALFSSFLDVQLSIRQCQKQPLPYTAIQLTHSALTVGLTVLFLELFSDSLVLFRLLAIMAGTLITFLISYLYINRAYRIKKRFSLKLYGAGFLYIVSYGLPLTLHLLSHFAKGQLDRVFIYHTYSAEQLGMYSAGLQLAMLLNIVLLAVNRAVTPYYFESLRAGKLTVAKLKKYALFSYLVLGLPAVICYLLPQELFSWFLGEGFGTSKYYAVMFLLGYGLMLPYFILANYLFYFGKTLWISAMSIGTALVYIALLVYTSSVSMQMIPFSMIGSNVFLVIVLWVLISKNAVNTKTGDL